jgi:hypothetical protein
MAFSAKINTCCGSMQNKHQHVVLYAISSNERDKVYEKVVGPEVGLTSFFVAIPDMCGAFSS